MRRRARCLLLMLAALVAPASAEVVRTKNGPALLEIVAKGLDHPWALAFLPDGRMLVTERPGRLRIVSMDGKIEAPISGVPAVYTVGQGGLLDVALAPDFARSRTLYLSYAEPREGGAATSVLSARLNAAATALETVKVIFRQQPASNGPVHFGSRIVPARDGTLFITTGERGQKEKAQDLATHYGKVIRIRTDGSVPKDNPYPDRHGAKPEIWSYGHRNMQGAAFNPVSGALWTVEHGAMGGDEINKPQAGRNYGWPVITYGKDYSGAKIGIGSHADGMEQPLHYWDPSIAPSGMMFYSGKAFAHWRNNLFVGALAGSLVARLELEGDRVVSEERFLNGLGHRYRDIREGPDGFIYLLTDAQDGKLLRLRPDNR